MKSHERATSKLLDSVLQDLNMYALAAGAAGVSMMALAQPSEAKIVYTRADISIGVDEMYNLDLNHDGITDFTISHHIAARSFRIVENVDVIPRQGNGIQVVGLYTALALQRGQAIGSILTGASQRWLDGPV